MLVETRDKFLPQNKKKKKQNEKTIMIATWHPALKHLFKILREKHHQHIEQDIHLRKSIPRETNNYIQ